MNPGKIVASDSRNQPIRKVGYVRTSSRHRDPDIQIAALRQYGVPDDLIFVDQTYFGSATRQAFTHALKACQQDGSQLVVWRLDRLGRSLGGILDTLRTLSDRGIDFFSVTEQIDTTGPMGEAMQRLLDAFAELERDLIRERMKAGIDRAGARGKTGGRPRAMTKGRIAAAEEMLAKGERGNTIWKALRNMPGPSISRAAYFAWQQEWDHKSRTPGIIGE